MHRAKKWWLSLPLALYGADALAWGLETHVFFAQHALLLTGFLAPQLRRAALALPHLVLAGACLPELPLFERTLDRSTARHHSRRTARSYAASNSDEARAIAVGYASHLLAEEVACALLAAQRAECVAEPAKCTLALLEWAMDEHVRRAVFVHPEELLEAESKTLGAVLAPRAGCSESVARAAVRALARTHSLWRRALSPRFGDTIPEQCNVLLPEHLDACARETAKRLTGIGRLLAASAS